VTFSQKYDYVIKHFGRARVKTLSLSPCVSISFSANVSNREWILGSVGITSNHVFSMYLGNLWTSSPGTTVTKDARVEGGFREDSYSFSTQY